MQDLLMISGRKIKFSQRRRRILPGTRHVGASNGSKNGRRDRDVNEMMQNFEACIRVQREVRVYLYDYC